MVLLLVAVCWCRENRHILPKCKIFQILHQNRAQKIIQCHDNNIWKQMCIKKYLIVLRPIFDKTYKGENRLKYTYELYITNWSHSNKVGFFLLCTREWYWREHIGLDHVYKGGKKNQYARLFKRGGGGRIWCFVIHTTGPSYIVHEVFPRHFKHTHMGGGILERWSGGRSRTSPNRISCGWGKLRPSWRPHATG